MEPTRLETAADFKQYIAEPDVADYLDQPEDLRRAMHAALSLFTLRDWVWEQHKPHPNIKDFECSLIARCSDFKVIADVANALKHMIRTRGNPTITKASEINAQPTPGPFDPDVFDSGAFECETVIIKVGDEDGASLRDAVINVKAMWDCLFVERGW